MRLARIVAMLAVASAATLTLTATASAATASAATCAGSGYLATSTGTLQRFSMTTNAVTTTSLSFGARFDDIAVSADGRTLYAVDSLANVVRIFDAATGIATITVSGFSTPTAIALSPDGTRVYVANQGGSPYTVAALETTTNTIVAGFSVSLDSPPTDLAVSADGSLVYVTVGSLLQARSATNGILQTTYTLAGSARAVALSATKAYTAVLSPFSVESALLSGSRSALLYEGMAGQPRSIAVSPDGATLYVGTMALGVGSLLSTTIGSSTLSPVGTATSFGALSIAVTPDSATVYGASANEVAVLLRGTSTPTTLAGAVASDITAVALCPAATVPGAPTAATADPGDAVVSLVWTAPIDTGGAPITRYTATATPGGITCTTTGATACLFSGLKNGTPYTFTVTATNTAGTSPASAASTKVTPRRDNRARALTLGPATVMYTKKGVGVAFNVTATGPGVIAAVMTYKGDRYCSVSRRVTALGIYRVRCVMTAAGCALARKRTVTYTLNASFSPTNGPLASAKPSVVVERRR